MSTPRHWAKAPEFADPGRIEAIRTATDGDKNRYTRSGLQPVQCRACSTCVLVKKNSDIQTSIQWTAPSEDCLHWAATAPNTNGRPSALRDPCPELAASIVHAVQNGSINVAQHPEDTVDD